MATENPAASVVSAAPPSVKERLLALDFFHGEWRDEMGPEPGLLVHRGLRA
jgi:hypothetical protein